MAGVLESKSACCQKPRGGPTAQKLTVLAPTTTTPASHARRPKPACVGGVRVSRVVRGQGVNGRWVQG